MFYSFGRVHHIFWIWIFLTVLQFSDLKLYVYSQWWWWWPRWGCDTLKAPFLLMLFSVDWGFYRRDTCLAAWKLVIKEAPCYLCQPGTYPLPRQIISFPQFPAHSLGLPFLTWKVAQPHKITVGNKFIDLFIKYFSNACFIPCVVQGARKTRKNKADKGTTFGI